MLRLKLASVGISLVENWPNAAQPSASFHYFRKRVLI